MLTPQERKLFDAMLLNREGALSWEFHEIGQVRENVAPPQRIRTIPHQAWQAPQFPIPRALNETVKKLLQERLQRGTLERCHGPIPQPMVPS